MSDGQQMTRRQTLLTKKKTMMIPKKTRLERKCEIWGKHLKTYELYIKTLLGIESTEEEELEYNVALDLSKHLSKDEEIFPECVITLNNPDFRTKVEEPKDNNFSTSLEFFQHLQSALKFNHKMFVDLLLLKAIESIYFNLPVTDQFNNSKKDSIRLISEENENRDFKDNQRFGLLVDRSEVKEIQTDKNGIHYELLDIVKNYVTQLEEKFHQFLEQNIHGNILDCLILNYKELKQTPLKKWKGGQYLDNQNNNWNRTYNLTSDVQTLLRHALIIKLNRIGFNTKMFISEKGDKIFVLFNMQDSNLKIIADQSHILKQLNFWSSDLFSLEPVDQSYRPLRTNNRLWKPNDFNVSFLVSYLRPQIIKLIKQINFKAISRETNQSFINSQLFEYGKFDFNENDQGPSEEEWIAYHKYLTHLEKRVRQIREECKIDNDIGTLLNKQVNALQLYKYRNSKNKEIQYLDQQNIQDPINQEHLRKIKEIEYQAQLLMNEFSTFQFPMNIPIVKSIKLMKKEFLCLSYLDAFQEALTVANGESIKLFSFWERINVSPYELYHPYTIPNRSQSKVSQAKQEQSWCKYVKNENNQISLFSSNERLKLVYQAVSQELDLSILYQLGIVRQIFCLNDHYELFGQCSNLQAQMTLDARFFQKKPFLLVAEWKLDYLHPWVSPCDMICGYYGEKIGLYFHFMSYFTEMTTPMAFFGLGCSLTQWIIWDNDSQLYILVTIVFAFIQIQWSNIFTDLWKQKQIFFNLKQGQSHFNEQQVLRSKFKGKYIRSLINDQLNSIQALQSEFLKRLLVSMCVLMSYILFYLGIVVALFIFTIDLHNKFADELQRFDIATFEVTSAACLNFIAQQTFDHFFDFVASFLTDYENYQTVDGYETSFVLKKFIFSFFSYLAPLLFLEFLNQPLNLYCSATNCEKHVKYYFSTIIMLILCKQIIKFGIFIFKLGKYKIKDYDYKESDIFDFVEEQSQRQPYSDNPERYGTMQDYMELFVLISFLSVFGYTFPFSFFILWISNIMQIQVKKNTFLYCLQRPWPKNESSLGIWNQFLEIISLLSLLSNTGVVTQQYNKSFGYELILVFLSVLIFNCFCKFFIGSIFGQIPDELMDLMKRHKYLIKSTVETKNKEGKSQENKEHLQRYPILKVFGTNLISENGVFETISSDDELKDHFSIPKTNQQLNILGIEQPKFLEKVFPGEFSIVNTFNHYDSRNENWAFKCIFQNRTPKQKLKLSCKIYTFLYKSQVVSKYKYLWTDQRVSQRAIYMRRSKQIMRNLDYRRYFILSKNFQTMTNYYDEKAQQKFRKEFQLLGNQANNLENQEYQQLMNKYNKYVNKHSWLNSRKVVVLKFKALIFKGFRKQVVKKKSLQIIQEFYRMTKIMEDLEPENPLQAQFDEEVDYTVVDKFELDDFLELFGKIILKPKTQFYLPLSSKKNNSTNSYIDSLKSEEFKNILDLSKDSSIFQQQTHLLQDIILSYFEDECFPIPKITFVKHFHENIWLVKLNEDPKTWILQFIQVKHGEQLQYQKYCDLHEGVLYIESTNYIRMANIVDQIDDFYIKGYCLSLYDANLPKSFSQVLEHRRTYGLPYTEAEIKQFIHANLNLLKLMNNGHLNSKNLFLINGEYYILNSQVVYNSFFELGRIVMEMIYLEEIEDIKVYFEKLNHPLKWLINELLFIDDPLEKLQNWIAKQYCFQEMKFDIEKKNTTSFANTYQNYTWTTLHKVNLNFRLKQFSSVLHLIKHYEEYIKIEVFDIQKDPFQHFIKILINDVNYYLLSSHEMKRNTDLMLIYYYQIASKFQQKMDVSNPLKFYIDALQKLSKDLQVVVSQLTSNINTANLNATEQCIILKTHQQLGEEMESVLSKPRLFLLAKLRKNQKLIENMILFKMSVNRFLNQLLALYSLQQYFSENYEYANLGIQTVVDAQSKLAHKEELPEILSEARELSPTLLNFNQMSPGLEHNENQKKRVIKNDDGSFNIQNEVDENPLYAIQYLYYLYLQCIILHDCKSDLFVIKSKEFINLNLKHIPAFVYLQQLLRSLQKDPKLNFVDRDYLQQQSECELGKYIVLQINKNREIKQYCQTELVKSNQIQFNWKQVLSYMNLKCTETNKDALLFILAQPTQRQQMKILLDIKIIHFLLKIYDYCPLNNKLRINSLNTDFLGSTDVVQTSKILKLQQLHSQYVYGVNTNLLESHNTEGVSWIYHQALLQLRLFIFLSYCFAYSKKHFDNQTKNLSDDQHKILSQMKNLMGKGDNQYAAAKYYLMLQIQISDITINQQSDYYLYHQYISIYLKEAFIQKFTLSKISKQIKPVITEQFRESIFVLCLIQTYIEFQEFHMAGLMITFAKALINLNAVMFENAHENFGRDLHILEAILQDKRQSLIKSPDDRLYVRSDRIDFYEDQTKNARYLLFNMTYYYNIPYSYLVIEDFMVNHFKKVNLTMQQMMTVLFCYMKAQIGDDEILNQLKIIHEYKFEEGSLLWAFYCHLMCRYYLSMLEYEKAEEYSLCLLSYLDTLNVQEGFYLKEQGRNNYTACQSEKMIIKSICQPKGIIIKETAEDTLFENILDDFFVLESILNHLEALAKDQSEIPSLQILLQFQLKIHNQRQRLYFWNILAHFFNKISKKNDISDMLEKLKEIRKEKIAELKAMKTLLKKKQNAKILLKDMNQEEADEFEFQQSLLEFQIKVYKATNNANQKIFLQWSSIAAERALTGYTKQSKDPSCLNKHQISQLKMLMVDNFKQLEQLCSAIITIRESEDILVEWFKQKKHPLKGYYFYHLGLLKMDLYQKTLKFLEDIIETKIFNLVELRLIIQGLATMKIPLWKMMDKYEYGDYHQWIPFLKEYISEIGDTSALDMPKFSYSKSDGKTILDEILQNNMTYDLSGTTELIDAENLLRSFEAENQYTKDITTRLFKNQNEKLISQVKK